jgi:hypothetical protein
MCDMFATAKSSVLPGNGGVNVNLVEAMWFGSSLSGSLTDNERN